MARARVVVLSALIALALGLSGCAAVAPTPTPTPTETLVPSGDGVLRIATLADMGTADGAAQVAGVEVAIREINEAGGVGGVAVEALHRNAGSEAATAIAAAESLSGRGVDVVIGPASAALADAVAPTVTASGAVLLVLAAVDTEQQLVLGLPPSRDASAVDEAFRARVLQSDPGLSSIDGAARAYDATVLAALAAIMTQDDGGASISWALRSTPGDGIECRNFGECLEVIGAGYPFRYVGQAGAASFGAD